MTTPPWYLEIVHVSSHEKQDDLLALLHEVDGVTALGSSSGPDHYVVFECSDRRLRTAIENLFGEVDPAAVLTETHRQPLQPEGGETPDRSIATQTEPWTGLADPHGNRGKTDDRYTT